MPVYLDYNATALVRPQAAEAVAEALRIGGNPSSVHRMGRAARKIVEQARASIAAAAQCRPAELIFTSGGAEANNLALKGVTAADIATSAIEHDTLLAAMPQAARIGVTADGAIDLAALESWLSAARQPALVSVMAANNETGVVQPTARIAALCRQYGALFHCDAVQMFGKAAFDIFTDGADLVTLSAHKIGGPQGVGALIVRNGVVLAAQIAGGGQELGRRSGTENVPGIAGFGRAVEVLDLGAAAGLAALRDRLEAGIAALNPDAVIFGRNARRLPNTSCFASPGHASELQVMSLDLAGVCVSAGSACSSGKVKASPVLRAMGAAPELAGSAIRISLGWASTDSDVDAFLVAYGNLLRRRIAS